VVSVQFYNKILLSLKQLAVVDESRYQIIIIINEMRERERDKIIFAIWFKMEKYFKPTRRKKLRSLKN